MSCLGVLLRVALFPLFWLFHHGLRLHMNNAEADRLIAEKKAQER